MSPVRGCRSRAARVHGRVLGCPWAETSVQSRRSIRSWTYSGTDVERVGCRLPAGWWLCARSRWFGCLARMRRRYYGNVVRRRRTDTRAARRVGRCGCCGGLIGVRWGRVHRTGGSGSLVRWSPGAAGCSGVERHGQHSRCGEAGGLEAFYASVGCGPNFSVGLAIGVRRSESGCTS